MSSTRDERIDLTLGRLESMSSRVAAHTAIEALLSSHAKSMPQSATRSLPARLFGAPVLTPESRSRYLRALTGRQIGERLDLLGPDWVVLNAVPVGVGHPYLDHLVIGPGGVIAITIPAADREELWDAAPEARRMRERRALRESEFAIGAVERRLTSPRLAVRVTGLIVAVDRPAPRSAPESPDLHVVPIARVAEWILALPGTLSPAVVARIAEVADLGSTWHPEPHPPACGAHLLLGFESLRREVRAADQRRRFWLLGLTVTLVGLVALSALGVLAQAGVFG